MTISHGEMHDVGDDAGVVFSFFLDTFCSLCAPSKWTVEVVEQKVNDAMPIDGWKAVDKSTLGLGSPTPNPCNQYPDRKHWFMIRNP